MAMQAKEGLASLLGSLRAKPATSLVMDLPCSDTGWGQLVGRVASVRRWPLFSEGSPGALG